MSRRWVVERVGDQVELTQFDGDRQHTIAPHVSQRVWNHSPTGFECGYGGSGPAQLALAILLEYFVDQTASEERQVDGIEVAVRHHQRFKFEFVATAPREGFVVTDTEIAQWLAGGAGRTK